MRAMLCMYGNISIYVFIRTQLNMRWNHRALCILLLKSLLKGCKQTSWAFNSIYHYWLQLPGVWFQLLTVHWKRHRIINSTLYGIIDFPSIINHYKFNSVAFKLTQNTFLRYVCFAWIFPFHATIQKEILYFLLNYF